MHQPPCIKGPLQEGEGEQAEGYAKELAAKLKQEKLDDCILVCQADGITFFKKSV
jgi:hypothetical protein